MSLETKIQDAFERRSHDVDDGHDAWPGLKIHLERSHQRRVTATVALSLAIIVTLGLGIAQIPGGGPGGFARQGSFDTFRYRITTTGAAGQPGAARTVTEGSIDLGRDIHHSIMRAELAGREQTLESIFHGTTQYFHLPEGARQQGEPEWIVNDLGVFPFFALPAVDTIDDPTTYRAEIERIAASFEEAGTATIRGLETTKYRAVIPARRGSVGAQQQPWQVTPADADPARLVMMLDGNDVPHRIIYTQNYRMDGRQVEARTVVDLFDFGADLDLRIPDGSETMQGPPIGRSTPSATFSCTGTSVGGETQTSGDC